MLLYFDYILYSFHYLMLRYGHSGALLLHGQVVIVKRMWKHLKAAGLILPMRAA